MDEVSLDQLSARGFAELVQTSFQVVIEPGRTVNLELTAVSAPQSSHPDAPSPERLGFERFSLLFSGPEARPLAQGTYRFEHERLGWFYLFIVPVSADHGARQYEAVFNRRTGAGTAPPASPTGQRG